MTPPRPRPRIGTAGWSIPTALADAFPGSGSHLERYARVMDCVEIDSSFYRPHRRTTYERWTRSTPDDFRFAVKMPREITHDRRFEDVSDALDAFLDQVAGLGHKLGVILMQLPTTFGFDVEKVEPFFELLRSCHAGPVACEPRERRWFQQEAEQLMTRFAVMRVAADPAIVAAAEKPGGGESTTDPTAYFRWHGSPKMYRSSYSDEWLSARAAQVADERICWCIFDNTAAGSALANALSLKRLFH